VIRKTWRSKRQGKRTGKYASGFEARIAEQFENAGVPFRYEGETLAFTQPRKYRPDFILPNGIYIEVKGYFPSEDRTKMRLVKEQHPSLDIRIILSRPQNRISKQSKTTYAKWCDDHGFPWAEGSVPISWLKNCSKTI
jgi:hypothetical protein